MDRKHLLAAALVALSTTTISCLQVSGGTWIVRSAATPHDWPDPTPVGQVEVKEYPAVRAARVSEADQSQDGMFRALFEHIQDGDIAMTAPVEMTYAAGDDARRTSMAFLYRSRDLGPTGEDGTVRVVDVEPVTMASVGVRGEYTAANHARGVARLEAWLAGQDTWRADGPPRFLGYNGPFVPGCWRYGEVVVPLRATTN